MTSERKQQRRIRRDRRRERRRVHANPYIHRFLRFVTRQILLSVFYVETVGFELVNRRTGPFIIMGNHSSVIDPLIVGVFVNKPIHYVVSDSQFRSRVLGWVLNLVGSIPKTKAMSDLDTVKKIVAVKSSGGVIGIFPEGQSSWDGHSLPIMRATDKLVKSLKIPVYIARIEGAYLAWPRWARRFRRGPVRITFHRLFDGSDLKKLSVSQVRERLEDALTVNVFSFQEQARFTYHGPRQAEYVERVLFVCPRCESLSTLVSDKRRVRCTACGHTVHFKSDGFFEAPGEPLRFRTIREWNTWQLEWFRERLAKNGVDRDHDRDNDHDRVRDNDRELLREAPVVVREGYKSQPLKTLGEAAVTLTRNNLSLYLDGGRTLEFPLAALEGINVQNNEHLEFYVSNSLYRLTTVSPRGNTFKWYYAIQVLQGGNHADTSVSVNVRPSSV